ncbi:hypothetical protein ABTY59_37345 [Streptomyces sp. NPDC096079]|uniref:hypothetical protein n=1 Tax=Streptomyces sp. NPDC096079 TaxID=3155820 RepID=UPI00333375A5
MTTSTAAQQAPDKGKAGKAPVMLRPFFPGSLDLETRTYQKTGTLSASQTPLDTFYPKTNGFLADLFVEFSAVAAGNAAAVAFKEDAPEISIANFQLSDTGGQPILGPMTGWELKTFVKHGGFSFSDDPRQSQTYSAVTGGGATGGSFSYILHIPVQFVRREPLGPLPNTNSNSAYAVDMTVGTLTQIYSTAPTNAPTYTVKIWQDSYRQSSGKDAQGNATVTSPPGLGAVLYLRRNTMELAAGNIDEELSQQEGSYRTLHFVLRDSLDSRATGDTDWPDPMQVYFNNDVPYDRTKSRWIRQMERDYGYINTVETPGGRDRGHFVLPFIVDNSLKAGSEDRYRYLSVSAADTLGVRGTIGGAGTHKLTTMYQFVRPPGGNIKGLTAR